MFAVSIGMGTYHIKDYKNDFNPDMSFPVSVKGYYGKNHKIELGPGVAYSSIVKAGNIDFKPKRENDFHTFVSIGYQYNKTTGGILFGCAYTPIIEFNSFTRHWACVSIGYSF